MLIKSGVDYFTPLFVAIDVSTEGEVVIICDVSMKAEAEGIFSHLGIYVVLVLALLLGKRSQCLTKKVWNHTNTAPPVVVLLNVTHQPLPPTIALIVNFPSADSPMT